MLVTALKSFDHNGIIRRGTVFECSEIVANALKRAKLVDLNEEPAVNPSMAVASPPSASLPAPPLQQTIVKPLDVGEPKLKKKPGRKKKL